MGIPLHIPASNLNSVWCVVILRLLTAKTFVFGLCCHYDIRNFKATSETNRFNEVAHHEFSKTHNPVSEVGMQDIVSI